MLIERISLDLYGDNFSPKELLEEVNFPYIVFNSNEAEDLKFTNKEETYGFGSLSLLAPTHYGLQGELVDYENWYINVIENNFSIFKKYGITEINLFIEVYFTQQCNFEIFSREGLANLSKFNVAIPISVYKLSDEQIIDMLEDAKLSKEKISEFVTNNS